MRIVAIRTDKLSRAVTRATWSAWDDASGEAGGRPIPQKKTLLCRSGGGSFDT